MPKENFPWEAIAVLGRVLEENSGKYEPGHWRGVSVKEHCHHADYHLGTFVVGVIDDDGEDHLAHAFVRLAMAVAVRESEKLSTCSGLSVYEGDTILCGPDGMVYIRKEPFWHDDWM